MQAGLTTRRLTFRDIFLATTIPLWLRIEVFLLSWARNPLSSKPVLDGESTARPRWPSSTSSRYSTNRDDDTRPSARSVRPSLNDDVYPLHPDLRKIYEEEKKKKSSTRNQ